MRLFHAERCKLLLERCNLLNCHYTNCIFLLLVCFGLLERLVASLVEMDGCLFGGLGNALGGGVAAYTNRPAPTSQQASKRARSASTQPRPRTTYDQSRHPTTKQPFKGVCSPAGGVATKRP